MEKILAVAALALFLCRPAVATTARELRELRGSAFKAYQGKDWPAFFEAQKRVVQAARIPRELYQLACAAALAGDKSAALRALEDFADQDTFLDAANDGDLASLRGEPRYEKALRRIAYSRAARGTTPTAAELPRADLDAATGAVKARHDSPAKGALADLRVFDGAAYASDGFGGGVYRVTSKGFEKLSDDFASPQTPAMHGGELLVPDYTLGLAVLDLGTRKVRWLEAPKGFPLTGIDGTALAGDDLYIVQNGLDPVRVVKLTLDRRNRIVKAALVQKGGDLPDPTHAVIHDGALWFIARSGWQGFGKNGFQPGPPPLLKRVPLR